MGQNVQAENNDIYSEFENIIDNYEQMYESEFIPSTDEQNLISQLTIKSKFPTLLSKHVKI